MQQSAALASSQAAPEALSPFVTIPETIIPGVLPKGPLSASDIRDGLLADAKADGFNSDGREYAHALGGATHLLEMCLKGDTDEARRLIEKKIVREASAPGIVVPAFHVSRYLACKDDAPGVCITADRAPWVNINYHDALNAAHDAGLQLISETQWLAIALDIAAQDINWTGGKVGEGSLYQGLRKGHVSRAQPAGIEPTDPDERRWHQLSTGEKVFDFAGNAYSWIFDDVQGDQNGIVNRAFAADSPSIAAAPHPSMQKGMGWRPSAGDDWSGHALVRGGCWGSGSNAGVFHLDGVWPGSRYDLVGFRCTKPIGL